jgi:exosortase
MSRSAWAWFSIGVIWVALCWHLSHHWEADPQYAFGWLVPALAIFLAARRWKSRPAASPASGPLALAMLVGSAAAILPLWLIAQPNPEWRLVSWLFSGVVIVFTLGWCARAGGGSWVRHFAFPVCFVLTAIPWPSAWETAVIQGLTRFVAGAAVEALNAGGIVAVQRGNLIEVGTGLLGVNEACSGIRSLQASLMVSIFLGELLDLSWAKRGWLVAISLGTALLGNVVRATFLAQAAARAGGGEVDRWHDPAGYTILTACLIVTWLAGLKFAPPLAPAAPMTGDCHPHALDPRLGTALALWFVAVGLGTEWWFRAPGRPPAPTLLFTLPADAREVAEIPIDPAARDMLRFDEHQAATWREPTGQRWTTYHFTWKAGPARTRILARMHRPETCLTAAGHRLEADRGVQTFAASGTSLPFHAYTFGAGPETVQVYYGLWENRAAGFASDVQTSAVAASLRAVWQRERHLSQQVLELALFDYPTPEEADEALRRRLPGLLKIQPVVPK